MIAAFALDSSTPSLAIDVAIFDSFRKSVMLFMIPSRNFSISVVRAESRIRYGGRNPSKDSLECTLHLYEKILGQLLQMLR